MKSSKKNTYLGILTLILLGFSGAFSLLSPRDQNNLRAPSVADNSPLLYVNFENTLTSSTGETGITNGNWEYNTTDAILDSYSVYLPGENKNHIKWDYGSALSEGTMECYFHPTSLGDIPSAFYIMQAGEYFDSYIGLYHRQSGELFAQFVEDGPIIHTLKSSINITADQTYHFALTWGARGVELWMNGFLVASDPDLTNGLDSATRYYGIGNVPMGSSTNSGIGFWDEFQVSDFQKDSFVSTTDVLGDKLPAPTLNSIPSPDSDGNVSLSWNSVSGADLYHVFRSNQSISEINGTQTLINTTDQLICEDIELEEKTYYYAVVAQNTSGFSNTSNCESVVITYPPDLVDANTVLYCGFENTLASYSEHTAITNGGWSYEEISPLVETSSVSLLGENKNHVKWDYGSALSEGTIECFFRSTNLESSTGAKYILQGGDLFDGSFGVYYYKNGILRAQHVDGGTIYTLESSVNITSNQTYHIAYSWGSRGIELWLNNEIVASNNTIQMGLESFTRYYGVGNTPMGSSTFSGLGFWDEFRLSDIQRDSFTHLDGIIDEKPGTPLLNPIESPDSDGNISLSWNSVIGADTYLVYRSTQPISEINGTQTLINTTEELTCEDLNLGENTYYYVVVAQNASGFSNMSNCESVIISLSSGFEDEHTLLFCEFENSLASSTGESGITNGNWDYNTINALVDSTSLYLPGEIRNHIKWDYGSALSEGTMECYFRPTTLGDIPSAFHIMQAGEYYDSYIGLYHRQSGELFAQFIEGGSIIHSLKSSKNISANQTYHFALTWGSRGAELWLNGQITASDPTITNGLYSTTRYYGIGNVPMGSNTNSGIGFWDNFRLSDIQRDSFTYISDVIGEKPSNPMLNSIPSPDSDGNISLSWNSVSGADQYLVYRSPQYISEINGTQTLIDMTNQLTCEDLNLDEGLYYYAIVAQNASGVSNSSNCELVVVVLPPDLVDEHTLLYCGFENTLMSYSGHSAITNGGWSYEENNPLVELSSVSLPGENRNHIKWDYGSALSEGTMECYFRPTTLGDIPSAFYIMQAGEYYDSYIGLYHRQSGDLFAQFVEGGSIIHSLKSSENISANQTYHFALTWGSRGVELWLNGQIVASDNTLNDGLYSTTRYYGIGNLPMGSNTNSGIGFWDNFRLSDIQRDSFGDIAKIVGEKPSSPTLNSVESPDTDGNITLSWNSLKEVDSYNVYSYSSWFDSVNESIDMKVSTNLTEYTENNLLNGTYYYAVSAWNSSGRSLLSNCIKIEIAIPYIPPVEPEWTNGTWQDVGIGVSTFICTDENLNIWMVIKIGSDITTEIRLTYYQTNPLVGTIPENVSLEHFYQVEVLNTSSISYLSASFYFGDPKYSEEDLSTMCMYQFMDSEWKEPTLLQSKYENNIFMTDISANAYFALGNDLNPELPTTSSPFKIPGYDGFYFAASVFISFYILLRRRGIIKK
ncbi:hypothetical protein NEF87_005101 [Candidatus Lokiarchaeum ossiferum]|uniref:Fibronectin type-III domain-containing protein n=1 Tax=Candidatus Lokiarchaeum ossiferum TaxID=2951803 RepID=A0ABY6HZR8_9ARCH|nr:hypothetical protein NEF87_005101 [Candidatus Lokiarchaeum sp. B-35]